MSARVQLAKATSYNNLCKYHFVLSVKYIRKATGVFHWVPVSLGLLIGPNKKISVFRVTGLKTLGSLGTQIFFKLFFILE